MRIKKFNELFENIEYENEIDPIYDYTEWKNGNEGGPLDFIEQLNIPEVQNLIDYLSANGKNDEQTNVAQAIIDIMDGIFEVTSQHDRNILEDELRDIYKINDSPY